MARNIDQTRFSSMQMPSFIKLTIKQASNLFSLDICQFFWIDLKKYKYIYLEMLETYVMLAILLIKYWFSKLSITNEKKMTIFTCLF